MKSRSENLLLKYVYYAYKTDKAREYASQGFARRVSTVQFAIANTFKIIAPNTRRLPTREKLYNAQINIQACIANT